MCAGAKIDHEMVSQSVERFGMALPFGRSGDHIAQRNLPPLTKNFAAKWADIAKPIDEMVDGGALRSPSSIPFLVAPGEGGEPEMHNCEPGGESDAAPAAPISDVESVPGGH